MVVCVLCRLKGSVRCTRRLKDSSPKWAMGDGRWVVGGLVLDGVLAPSVRWPYTKALLGGGRGQEKGRMRNDVASEVTDFGVCSIATTYHLPSMQTHN